MLKVVGDKGRLLKHHLKLFHTPVHLVHRPLFFALCLWKVQWTLDDAFCSLLCSHISTKAFAHIPSSPCWQLIVLFRVVRAERAEASVQDSSLSPSLQQIHEVSSVEDNAQFSAGFGRILATGNKEVHFYCSSTTNYLVWSVPHSLQLTYRFYPCGKGSAKPWLQIIIEASSVSFVKDIILLY